MKLLKWIFQGITIYVCFILLTVVLGGCDGPKQEFYAGQCVQMKLDNLKGMVISASPDNVWVRFSTIRERTNTHILGSDEDIDKAPYATVIVKPFELMHCK